MKERETRRGRKWKEEEERSMMDRWRDGQKEEEGKKKEDHKSSKSLPSPAHLRPDAANTLGKCQLREPSRRHHFPGGEGREREVERMCQRGDKASACVRGRQKECVCQRRDRGTG